MDKAVAILREKIAAQKKIRIIGDYDADGVMASYILAVGLRECGADADIKIPHRIDDGYGLNASLVEEAKADGVDTILTCDNGISAEDAIRRAVELGMTVLVTDHHVVASMPTSAAAVVDPQREDDSYPCKAICGAAVAWKLVLALGADQSMALLPFVAFATVTDVVDLVDENRILLREGLRKLRQCENLGLRALAAQCGISLATLNTRQIGFVLGPCINASGRLDTAARASELLFAKTEAQAASIAQELKALNDSRRAMTEEGVALALARVEEEGIDKDPVMVIYLPEIHVSLAGLIAGRVREQYEHPCFVLTKSEEGISGSGRSIEAYHMAHALQEVSDLLVKFGGHPMAAGLHLKEENLPAFREAINANASLTEEDCMRQVKIDVPMPVSYASERIAKELQEIEPCGKGNPQALFADKQVQVVNARLLGKEKNILLADVFSIDEESGAPVGRRQTMKCFYQAEELMARIASDPCLCIAYQLQLNDYYQPPRLELVLRHYR